MEILLAATEILNSARVMKIGSFEARNLSFQLYKQFIRTSHTLVGNLFTPTGPYRGQFGCSALYSDACYSRRPDWSHHLASSYSRCRTAAVSFPPRRYRSSHLLLSIGTGRPKWATVEGSGRSDHGRRITRMVECVRRRDQDRRSRDHG